MIYLELSQYPNKDRLAVYSGEWCLCGYLRVIRVENLHAIRVENWQISWVEYLQVIRVEYLQAIRVENL